jgi:hypothetical protein
VTGRRLDPETGDIYHMTTKPPPQAIIARLTQVRAPRHAPLLSSSPMIDDHRLQHWLQTI